MTLCNLAKPYQLELLQIKGARDGALTLAPRTPRRFKRQWAISEIIQSTCAADRPPGSLLSLEDPCSPYTWWMFRIFLIFPVQGRGMGGGRCFAFENRERGGKFPPSKSLDKEVVAFSFKEVVHKATREFLPQKNCLVLNKGL